MFTKKHSDTKVLICSDDIELVEYALSLPGSNFFTVGGVIPKVDGFLSLHEMAYFVYRKNSEEGEQLFVKQLLDLIFLSRCESVYSMKSHAWGSGFSGFLELSIALKMSGNNLLGCF